MIDDEDIYLSLSTIQPVRLAENKRLKVLLVGLL
jgi:hypothetical protein